MEKYIIINDAHLFSRDETPGVRAFLDFKIAESKVIGVSAFRQKYYYIKLNGDIVDLSQCHASQIEEATKYMQVLAQLFDYNKDNHEKQPQCAGAFIVITLADGRRCKITHGAKESWGLEKTIAYAEGKKGAGFIKRWIILSAIKFYENVIGRTPSKDFIDNAYGDLVANNFDIGCYAHLHPKEKFDKIIGKIKPKRIMVLMRGINEIDFSQLT